MGKQENYLGWHYVYSPKRILEITQNYLIFFFHYFSVVLIIHSFFAPWKREAIQHKGPGFSFKEILNVVSYNLISRSIGIIVRFFTLITWLLLESFILVLGLIVVLLWIIIPGLTLPLFILIGPKSDPGEEILKRVGNNPKSVCLQAFSSKMASFVFTRLGINLEELTTHINNTPDVSGVFSFPEPKLSSLLYSLAKNWLPLKKYLNSKKIEAKDVESCCQWSERLEEERRKNARFWELENLLQNPGVGKSWAYGYTPELDQYSTDLSQPLAFSSHLVGRKKTVSQLERILSRSQGNNCLIIGEPGVGKQTIILNLAKLCKEGKINSRLAHKRVLSLNINLIIAGTQSFSQAKGELETIIKEAGRAGNVILVVNRMEDYLSNEEGKVNISDVFVKALRDDRVQVIGTTTPDNFQKYIFPNQEILKYFEKIEAVAPTSQEALVILEDTVLSFEKKTKTYTSYQALVEAIEKSNQYLVDIPFPEKAIDLVDEACTLMAGKPEPRLVTPKEIDFILAEKTKVPLGEIEKEEIEKLKKLEEYLHRRIVDQQEAIEALANVMRRTRLGITKSEKPIGSFLFLGPTGVGKTETAKTLAACYFGSEKQMVRLDMSEYQGEVGFNKALGYPQTNEPGIFAKEIRKNPFAVLLLDEIEKTDPKILNLFLTILDEGFFTDNFGKKIDCRNLIIIGTSNAGSEFIRQEINNGVPGEKLNQDVLEYVQKEMIFSPEFLNRFDGVIVYKPLTHDHLKQIAKLLLTDLNLRLAKKEISIKITDELVDKVATLGYQPTFGARPMARVIQDKIENVVAQKILSGKLKRGEVIEINL